MASTAAIRFPCPQCKQTLKVPAHMAGKRGTCPRCAAKLAVPRSSTAAKPVVSAPEHDRSADPAGNEDSSVPPPARPEKPPRARPAETPAPSPPKIAPTARPPHGLGAPDRSGSGAAGPELPFPAGSVTGRRASAAAKRGMFTGRRTLILGFSIAAAVLVLASSAVAFWWLGGESVPARDVLKVHWTTADSVGTSIERLTLTEEARAQGIRFLIVRCEIPAQIMGTREIDAGSEDDLRALEEGDPGYEPPAPGSKRYRTELSPRHFTIRTEDGETLVAERVEFARGLFLPGDSITVTDALQDPFETAVLFGVVEAELRDGKLEFQYKQAPPIRLTEALEQQETE